MNRAMPVEALLAVCIALMPDASLRAQGPRTEGAPTPSARAVQRAVQRMHKGLTAQLSLWTDHSTFENAWVARTNHFAVRTTISYGVAFDIARGLETMLGHFHRTLGIGFVPASPLPIFVFPTRAEYNAFGAANGEHHSSFYGSFFAVNHAEHPVAAEWSTNPILSQMQITHSVVHQYLHAAFPGATKPLWIDEGLAAYFTTFWDHAWSLGEYERIKKEGQLVPLDRILRAPIEEYGLDTSTRMLQLGMFFDYLLRWREDTRSIISDDGKVRGPFRDYLIAVLEGRDVTNEPFQALIADPTTLIGDFKRFEFPK